LLFLIKFQKKTAYDLTKKLFFGSSLLSSESSFDFSKMIENVTSKKGVTEASFEVLLKDNKFHKIIAKAVKNGVSKSKKL
jgi:pyrroline-5-carboxylate reductase